MIWTLRIENPELAIRAHTEYSDVRIGISSHIGPDQITVVKALVIEPDLNLRNVILPRIPLVGRTEHARL
jgi:hypothetical protein